jgi:transposase
VNHRRKKPAWDADRYALHLERGTDRLGRRAKRFLTPLQKDEVWLQLVCGQTTISEAADHLGVDRSTIMRLGTAAKDGVLQALAESRPGVQAAKRDLELEAARAEAARLGEALKELAVKLVLVEGNGRLGRRPQDSGLPTGRLGMSSCRQAQPCRDLVPMVGRRSIEHGSDLAAQLTVGYRGPCPPRGDGRHRYRFRLHAVAGDLRLAPDAGVQELERAVTAKVLAVAELVGTYRR